VLYTQKVAAELQAKRDQLSGYESHYGQRLASFREALSALGKRYPSAEAIQAAQRTLLTQPEPVPSLGASPTVEFDQWRGGNGGGIPCLPCGLVFAHHQEARAWAECLRGTTTFAVDGSQLPPWRDASVPIALVQAGLFENPHQPPAPYIKDVAVEVLSPDELLAADDDAPDTRTGEVLSYSALVVNLRRFELETRTLAARMEHHARIGTRNAVAFYDGSLIVSFALKMPPQYRSRYVRASQRLLAASQQYRIPLVGYIDTSYARDIVTMLSRLDPSPALEEARGVHDALLWQSALGWGDRSPAFISARDDLSRMGYGEQQADIAFVYFQAALDRPPARIEFPRWMLEEGRLDDVMTAVRAETVAGNGYPYLIEAADAVAVISAPDRAQFYALFQDFAAREGLRFSISRKALSKSRRRV
jgi:hypothetical protein